MGWFCSWTRTTTKTASFDAFCSIDVQLLCGAGLEETRTRLAAQQNEIATDAVDYLAECQAAGDFSDFSVETWSGACHDYYRWS
ncbi:hypothetical protein CC117_10995 [Parafrankia colletiae]|uniref:Uncharacterized protein n=1 Tax=Parafrankia colletiae TaxID=573497 RepID=A0A1S1RAZ0_9ACTN|nr:hypothetical protein [Parafrankia colletiae]MCK9900532.1 hypothetical protein [Frankia sp. Cpl3]OHV43146.1 hypothetical protein CC117_10995 [Parafrankia colletiae]